MSPSHQQLLYQHWFRKRFESNISWLWLTLGPHFTSTKICQCWFRKLPLVRSAPAIIWITDDLLWVGLLTANVSEIDIKSQQFSYKEMNINTASAKWHYVGCMYRISLCVAQFHECIKLRFCQRLRIRFRNRFINKHTWNTFANIC